MRKEKYFYRILGVILSLYLFACETRKPPFNRDYNNMLGVLTTLGPKRMSHAYNHSLLKMNRNYSDCIPECPRVDIWQYQYKPKNKAIIYDKKPISTLKKHWKIKDEARLIALTLYGNKPEYIQGLIEFLESIEYIKEHNNIKEDSWGYDTFTIRIYTPKRNPKDLQRLGTIENTVPQYLITKLLNLGCEIVFVDNKLKKAGRDATFWRFMVFDEPMQKGERVRYLLRDVDWLLTSAEVLAVGEWILSGYAYHRLHVLPICIGPLTASIWGGTHVGNQTHFNLHEQIENYPYRHVYGDDELFTRDIIWPRILSTGSVMTHIYKRDFVSWLASPYENSCDEPTKAACDRLDMNNKCIDLDFPDDIHFPYLEIALREPLDEIKKIKNVFSLKSESKRFEDVLCVMSKKCLESKYKFKNSFLENIIVNP